MNLSVKKQWKCIFFSNLPVTGFSVTAGFVALDKMCTIKNVWFFLNLYYEINSNLIGARYFIFKKLTHNGIPLHQNIQNIRIIKQYSLFFWRQILSKSMRI